MIERRGRGAAIAGALALALAGCNVPAFQLVYQVAPGPAQSCAPVGPPGAPPTCDGVAMACDAVLNVRVLRPSEPDAPFIRICDPVRRGPDERVLCSIDSVQLPSIVLPRDTLEVQVLVWPRFLVEDPATRLLECGQYNVEFSAVDNFPVPNIAGPSPAFGGRTFFHPGDPEVLVTLGCTDTPSINVPSCVGATTLEVRATIDNVRTGLPLTNEDEAPVVWAGEPQFRNDGYVLDLSELRALSPTEGTGVQVWREELDYNFASAACIAVQEQVTASTTTVRCRALTPPEPTLLDVEGALIDSELLDQIVERALGLPRPPDRGMTIGIVVDQIEPLAGYTVTTSSPSGTIEYLDATATAVIPGATQTSASGIFVSMDAPFNTTFRATNGPNGTAQDVLGGQIANKVTVVILEIAPVNQ